MTLRSKKLAAVQPAPAVDKHTTYKLRLPLPYTDNWYLFPTVGTRFPAGWRQTFLSKQVLVTREEFATLLLVKLGMDLTRQNLVRVVTDLEWKCFGSACLQDSEIHGVLRALWW